MSTPTTGSPPAGWYVDPSNAAAQRWFDGTAWTEHVQPPAAPTVPAVPTYVPAPTSVVAPEHQFTAYPTDAPARLGAASYGTGSFGSTQSAGTGWIQPVGSHYLANPASDLGSGTNTPARVGLVVSFLALLGVPVAAVAGIVLAFVGLKRARTLENAGWAPKGRTQARWALALSVIGAVLSVLLVIAYLRGAFTEAMLANAPVDTQAVETDIGAGIAAQAGIAVTVECPEVAPGTTSFQCVATDATGVPTAVSVDVTDGGWSWRIG